MIIDLRNIFTEEEAQLTEEQAQTLVKFFVAYDGADLKKVAEAFQTYAQFRAFEWVINKFITLEGERKKIKDAVQQKFPILVLIDVGGTIMCRTGNKLPVERRLNKEFCQIKMHYHYYRPQFDSFISKIISHPRAKLGFYTSIMKKNVMPVLFKIFDLPTLSMLRSEIFDEVFD